MANESGGSIYYNKYRPQVYSNNSFDTLNYAKYGPIIASYPIGVRVA